MNNMVSETSELRKWLENKAKEVWDNLDDDEIVFYEDRREAFVKIVRYEYGINTEQAEQMMDKFQQEAIKNRTRHAA